MLVDRQIQGDGGDSRVWTILGLEAIIRYEGIEILKAIDL